MMKNSGGEDESPIFDTGAINVDNSVLNQYAGDTNIQVTQPTVIQP
jgi:hypothetical protein